MKPTEYTTTPGTIPHRAIEFLKSQPPGAEFTTVEVGAALGIDPENFTWTMATAVRAGAVRRRFRPDNRRILYWSLGDGTPLDDEQLEAMSRSATKPAKPAKEEPPRTTWVKPAEAAAPAPVVLPAVSATPKIRKPRAKPVDTDAAHAEKPTAFRACLWTDGKLQLENDGNLMLLTAREVAQLRRLLGAV